MFRERWIQKLSPAVRSIFINESPNGCCRLLLEFSERKYDQTVDLIKANQGEILHSINLLPLLAVQLPLEALPKVADSLYVTKIWEDPPVSLQEERIFSDETTDEPMMERAHQSVSHSEVPVIPEYNYAGKGIVVAVLDTGIFPHQDLTVPNNRIVGWQDFVNHKKSPYDDHGHGTEVAGIIAGNGNTSGAVTKGMAPEAWLVGVKILDQEGNGRLSDMIAGLEWCVRSLPLFNIKILCLSVPVVYQEGLFADPLSRMIRLAWSKGITIFTPFETQKVGFAVSGFSQPLISVASLNRQQALALNDKHFSNPDSSWSGLKALATPDLIAEGEKLVSLSVEGGYTTCSGNTIAAAMAAGGAALLLEKWPVLGPARVRYYLTKRAKDLGLGKNLQGFGLLNLNILGNTKNKASLARSTLPQNMNQILPVALKLLIQNSASSGKDPNEFFMNLLGSLIRSWTHSFDSIN